MSKYIIKNCPACRQYQAGIYTCDDLYDCDLQRCQDCTDCVMKQIVELCKKVKLTYGQLDKPLTETQCAALFSRATLADEILQLLDIQEVE
jgi:hypothetical protein